MADDSRSDAFPALAGRFGRWLTDRALPLWAEKGLDRTHGGFHDLVTMEGRPVTGPKRGRVQGRQSWVFALAGTMGWQGPWAEPLRLGLDFLMSQRRQDGQLPTLFAHDGSVRDESATLYDQTFFLLALAEATKHVPEQADLRETARRVHQTILATRRHPAGGFVESAEQAFQSNPHMHLLEAALAWRQVEPDGMWDGLADEVVRLALTRFLDSKGAIREYYDAEWRPTAGAPGCVVMPGHQFEWAWLLGRWGRLRGDAHAAEAARRLFEIGSKGVDIERGVAMDELDDEFRATRLTARLWPQTERLKAALAFMAASENNERARYRAEALNAAKTLWRYLETPVAGLWRDRMLADGSFVEEPAPASSFYHIICAIQVMMGFI